jgi:hypothetical protein
MRAVFSCFNSAQRPLIGLFIEPQLILTSYPFGFLERSQVFFFSFKILSRKNHSVISYSKHNTGKQHIADLATYRSDFT